MLSIDDYNMSVKTQIRVHTFTHLWCGLTSIDLELLILASETDSHSRRERDKGDKKKMKRTNENIVHHM